MEELALHHSELIGRESELAKLRQALDNAISGKGSTIFIAGEAGIGKTRLVSELIKEAETKNVQIIQGRCLFESLEPMMPIKSALREAGLFHLISGDPPPLVVSAYLMNDAGLLIAKSVREELGLDPYIFGSMLKAVGSFVKDSMRMVDNIDRTGGLNSIGYQEFKIIMEESASLHLAVVTKGNFSEFLVSDMRSVLADVQFGFSNVLKDWDGDLGKLEGIDSITSKLIKSGKYDGKFLVDDPKIRQENLFDNVLLGFQRLAQDRPLLLFLDDLHWADPSSLGLLHYLARNTKNDRVLIVGDYRPEDIVQQSDGKAHHLEIVMQNMTREDLLDKIDLTRLDRAGTEGLVSKTLGAGNFDAELYNRIFRETEGTPFFVLEVVKLLVEEGWIKQDKKGVWSATTGLDKMDIPSRVYDVVKRRLDRLKKEQREILECASVIGEQFQTDIIGKSMELNKLLLLKNLSEIEKTHKLIHSMEKKFRFDHAKIREVLYGEIIDELKVEYHRLIADAIAELHKDNLDEILSELAVHYYKAKDERAGEYLVKAGDKAKERYANEEAIRFYQNSLDFIVDIENEKVGISEKLGDVQMLIGEYDGAIENYKKAGEATDTMEVKVRMLRKIGDAHQKKGEYDESLKVLTEAKKSVEEGKAEHGRILLIEGRFYHIKADYDKGLALFQEANKIFEEFGGEQKDVGNALRAVGSIYMGKGEYDPALEYYEKSLAVMVEIKEQYGIAAALDSIGIVHSVKGELDKALEFYERSLEIREKIGDKHGVAASLLSIGFSFRIKGELDRALEFYERSLAIGLGIGAKFLSMNNYCMLAEVKIEMGDVQIALENAEKALEIAAEIGTEEAEGMSRHMLGMVWRETKDWDKAIEEFDKANILLEEVDDKKRLARLFYEYALLFKAKGEPAKAKEYLEKALSEFERMGMKLWAEKCRNALEELSQ